MENVSIMALYSSGLESFVGAHKLKAAGHKVIPLIMDYGQSNWREVDFARDSARRLGLEKPIVDNSLKFFFGDRKYRSSEGVVSSNNDGSMGSSYTPNRNLIFLAAAQNTAIQMGIYDIAIFVNDVGFSYPDSTVWFIETATDLLSNGNDLSLSIHTPTMKMSKADSYNYCMKQGILEDAKRYTNSCFFWYVKEFEWGVGCGKCASCLERESEYKFFVDNFVDK